MSLISDPEYLIHNLRLTYLRHVDDPYGPRIISLNPRYSSNPHVLAAGLADVDRWPELVIPSSPLPTEDEGTTTTNGRRRHSGFPGATGLKYTQTIMGPSRTGALGMRVSAKRALTSREPPLPPLPSEAQTKRTRSDSAPTPVSAIDPVNHISGSPETHEGSLILVSKRRSAGGSSLSEVPVSLIEESEITPGIDAAKDVQFVPDFARGTEMEARRRQRMRARFAVKGNNVSQPQISPELGLNPGSSSSEDEEELADSLAEDDEFEDLIGADEGIDGDADEFDPDFAPPQSGITSDSASDVLSTASITNSALSTSHSFTSSLQVTQSIRNRSRLSPVAEGRVAMKRHAVTEDSDAPGAANIIHPSNPSAESYFEMVTPPLPTKPADDQAKPDRPRAASRPPEIHTHAPQSDDFVFSRRKVLPARSSESTLTAKLASSKSTSSNPFTELYALISGRAEVASMIVNVFFPQARSPAGKPLELNVRKDASVEEVIGFALWSYWEEGWLPKLDEGLGEDDPRRKAKLSAVGWVLRIAEEDGELDEDFPAPDRMGKISKFNFDAYAILEANNGQMGQNHQLESKIVRRPSRIIVAKKKLEPVGLAPPSTVGPGTSVISGSTLGTSVGLSTSLGLLSNHRPQVLLRIRVADMADTAVHYSTAISVSAGVYMQEALEMVCRKCKITHSKEWALLLRDPQILIPLDRTVASLQGKSDLVLVMRSMLPQYGLQIDGDRRTARTTDPNASIFKRMSEVPEVKFSAEMDITAAYKRFTVFRKLPMLVARLERTLAIDGEYIHIMPSVNKARAVFDSMKTASYHIKSVIGCNQSTKSSSSFKFLVKRDGGDKRYDFEAETPKIANEIVACIRNLKSSIDRSGTVKQSRRSRHVG